MLNLDFSAGASIVKDGIAKNQLGCIACLYKNEVMDG